MRTIILFSLFVLVTATIVPTVYMNARSADETSADSVTVLRAGKAAGDRKLTLLPNRSGNFETDASINGRRMSLVVDTGASVIVLRESAAARLGIHPRAQDYRAKVSTANGIVMGAPTRLNRVDVGGLVVYDAAALVLPDRALEKNLLGMSFLSRVRFSHRNGRLVLEP